MVKIFKTLSPQYQTKYPCILGRIIVKIARGITGDALLVVYKREGKWYVSMNDETEKEINNKTSS